MEFSSAVGDGDVGAGACKCATDAGSGLHPLRIAHHWYKK